MVLAGAPAVTVLGGGVVIEDGDTTPGMGDGTDFGSVVQDSAGIGRTFTVRNDGSGILTLGAVTVPAGFTVTEGLSPSLATGASDTFTVRLDTATLGIKAGDISFTTNDPGESLFHFQIRGTVLALPEITVLGSGISITDGAETPGLTDGTDFGSVVRGSAAVSRTFTIRNDGGSPLTLGTVSVPTGYTLTKAPPGSLAAGASDTLTVQLETATLGTKAGDISFPNNDSDENPFHFRITGTITDAPEITVLGNGLSIANGDTTPSTTDGTDFCGVVQGGTAISHTFTVRNDGDLPLTLGAVSVPAGYTLTKTLVSSLGPGASDTFTVQLDTTTPGTKTGMISFATNDPDENPFDFQIAGNVGAPGNLDATFGTAGKVVTTVGTGDNQGRSVAIQPDGKIIVAGFSRGSGGNNHFALVRYNTDGSPDTSFGAGGIVTTVLTYGGDRANSVALQSDGKIVVAGRSLVGSNDQFSLVRYNTDGSLDTSFGVGGKVTTAISTGTGSIDAGLGRGYSV